MSALGPQAVAAVDRQSLAADVLDQPAQLEDALWRVRSAGTEAVETPLGLLVCGMGGSAIGGDLARACLGERARRPIRVARDYPAGRSLGAEVLVLLASYSGETEETLAWYEAARGADAPRVVLTTGGSLAAAARADGIPVIGVPAGLQPRSAVLYMTVGALECAALAGCGPRLDSELEQAAGLLSALVGEWGPGGPDDSEPKALARQLESRLPLVYGSGLTAPVARRWKTQLNENSKVPAFFSELPEADHNEIASLDAAAGLAPLGAVFLADPAEQGRPARRLALTAELARGAGLGAELVAARGESAVERVLSLVLYGDLVSLYLAVLRGVDPSDVAAIEGFKQALREGAW